MNNVVKSAFYNLLKGLIPLVSTFLGVVLGSIFNQDSTVLTAFVSGAVGSTIYSVI